MKQENNRGRWVAISTGVISIAIAVVYLLVVFLLDRQGPLLPPPPEALGGAVIVAPAVSAVPQPEPGLLQGSV